MSDCARFESTFEAYVAGASDETALGPLLVHCRACTNCRRLLELHRDLAGLASRTPEPDATDLAALEARVLAGLSGATARPAGTGSAPTAPMPARPRWGRPARVAAALAATVLLFVAGLATGRLPWERAGSGSDAGLANRLVDVIRADAASNRDLADVEDSRFTYSNASFRRVNGERLALDFDVTTHVQLVEPEKSELVRDILAQSLLNPSSTGTRLRAMEIAVGDLEPKVKAALLFAMQRDPSLAVRQEALAILADRLGDPDVQTAMLATLRDDDSVQMRLLALDSLAAHRIDRNRIREVIREQARPGDEALLVRLAEVDRKL